MDKFINELAEILDEDAKNLNGSSLLENFTTWDSLSHIVFITLLDKEYHKRAKAAEVREAKTIEDLYRFTLD